MENDDKVGVENEPLDTNEESPEEEGKFENFEAKYVVESKPLDKNEKVPMSAENVLEDCRKSLEDNLNEDDGFVNEFDEAFDVDIDEYNAWLSTELWEIENIESGNEEKVRDEDLIVDVKVKEELNDDPFHKQVFDDDCCNDDDEGKDAPMMVPILQAILAMLLTHSKTLHEQSEVIARLSRLFKPSLSNNV